MSIHKTSYSLQTREPIQDSWCDEELLYEEDYVKKVKKVSDCSKRTKACKNCICGRKDTVNIDLDPSSEDFSIPSGGCGSCSRGDAFRCAQCPYLGTPAWSKDNETGKITISN